MADAQGLKIITGTQRSMNQLIQSLKEINNNAIGNIVQRCLWNGGKCGIAITILME